MAQPKLDAAALVACASALDARLNAICSRNLKRNFAIVATVGIARSA
ncbi:hypothetical protein [Paraburkholderia metrosideri]|jgi:hypothetical protein|nr:hypothetical protein [Paraburkholderia metrosideri]